MHIALSRSFLVNAALLQYHLLTVDLLCTDLKDYRIVCLHIQIIDMKILKQKYYTFNHSIMPDQYCPQKVGDIRFSLGPSVTLFRK